MTDPKMSWAREVIAERERRAARERDDTLTAALSEAERLRARVAELEAEKNDLLAGMFPGCPVAGKEAEELRSGIEQLIEENGDGPIGRSAVGAGDLQRLLDRVDARDSLAHLESATTPESDDE